MQWLPIQSSPNTFHKHAEVTYQEANEEDAVVPSEWYPIKKYMEVYYPSLLWCGEQRQGMGLVIATHWSLVPSTSHFTDYCKIKKEKLTGKARKGVYKVRAPPPSQFVMLRLLFPLVDPLSLMEPLTLGWDPNSLHFSYTTWSSRFLHLRWYQNIVSCACRWFFIFYDKMEQLYRFELKKEKGKKDANRANLFICEQYTKFSYYIIYVYV